MKKVIVSILAIFYLCSSTGATVHLHYCMGKLINWGLNNEGSTCKNCGMEKEGGCCKDVHKFVKNDSDQRTAEAIQIPQATIDSPATLSNISEYYFFSIIGKDLISHPPPVKSGVDILIRNCVFRI